MKYFNFFFISVFLLYSCNGKNRNSSSNENLNSSNLKKEIIFNNDIESYGVFLDISANDTLNYESLSISLMLADRGNAKANFMVFYHLISTYHFNKYNLQHINQLSTVNKNFALYYLIRSAKMNDFAGQIALEEIYRAGIGLEKNKAKADSILTILKSKNPSFIPSYMEKN